MALYASILACTSWRERTYSELVSCLQKHGYISQATCIDLKWNHMVSAVQLPNDNTSALSLLTGWQLGWIRTHYRGRTYKHWKVDCSVYYIAQSLLSMEIRDVIQINLRCTCVPKLKKSWLLILTYIESKNLAQGFTNFIFLRLSYTSIIRVLKQHLSCQLSLAQWQPSHYWSPRSGFKSQLVCCHQI